MGLGFKDLGSAKSGKLHGTGVSGFSVRSGRRGQ